MEATRMGYITIPITLSPEIASLGQTNNAELFQLGKILEGVLLGVVAASDAS